MPSEINKPLICQQIGSLSASSIKAIERKYTMKCRTSPIRRPQNKNSTLKKRKYKPKRNPRANTVDPQCVPWDGRYVTRASLNIQERSTEYDDSNWIFGVLCLNDEKRQPVTKTSTTQQLQEGTIEFYQNEIRKNASQHRNHKVLLANLYCWRYELTDKNYRILTFIKDRNILFFWIVDHGQIW